MIGSPWQTVPAAVDAKYGMRLHELSRPDTRDKAEWILVNAGYKQLGRGQNAAVFHAPVDSHVLKLFNSSDRAYIDFVKLATANPNPHFPKFYGRIIQVTPGYFAVKTELLQPFTGSLHEVDVIDWYIMWARDKIDGANASFGHYDQIASQPDLKAACDLIAKFLAGTRYFCDVHSKNVMMRGETVVLSDPVCTTT
jgi:hypothetical protein